MRPEEGLVYPATDIQHREFVILGFRQLKKLVRPAFISISKGVSPVNRFNSKMVQTFSLCGQTCFDAPQTILAGKLAQKAWP